MNTAKWANIKNSTSTFPKTVLVKIPFCPCRCCRLCMRYAIEYENAVRINRVFHVFALISRSKRHFICAPLYRSTHQPTRSKLSGVGNFACCKSFRSCVSGSKENIKKSIMQFFFISTAKTKRSLQPPSKPFVVYTRVSRRDEFLNVSLPPRLFCALFQ